MDGFLNKDGKIIVMNLISAIQKNRDFLSEVDGLIGDGDHGINMAKGFGICERELNNQEANLSESLKTLGHILISEIGGSMGPLYGTFFNKMARRCRNVEVIDSLVFEDMLDDACDALSELGNAKVGDKTLMDVLIPASLAYRKAVSERKSFSDALQYMKKAAIKGMESTKDMVAKVGRASRLGERSRGVLDAGAVSCNLILQSMADSITELL